MSNEYEEELSSMKNGLDLINKIIANPKNRLIQNRALINRSIQEARIDFFKRGYKFRDMEVNSQRKLKC